MIISKKTLARRTLLRGVGATLALPMLDAMVPALSGISGRAAAPARPEVCLGRPGLPAGQPAPAGRAGRGGDLGRPPARKETLPEIKTRNDLNSYCEMAPGISFQ